MKSKIDKLTTELLDTLSNSPEKGRYFLGITGCPAAGKSMLARNITDEINFRTGDDFVCVIPMKLVLDPDRGMGIWLHF